MREAVTFRRVTGAALPWRPRRLVVLTLIPVQGALGQAPGFVCPPTLFPFTAPTAPYYGFFHAARRAC